jgi:hypothetical protein
MLQALGLAPNKFPELANCWLVNELVRKLAGLSQAAQAK